MSALSELVASERARLGLSLTQVQERSGGLVNRSTVNGIELDQRQTVTHETLKGLSVGLGLPLAKVERAAGLSRSEDLGRFELPRRADRLNRRERKAVLAMVDALLEAKRR